MLRELWSATPLRFDLAIDLVSGASEAGDAVTISIAFPSYKLIDRDIVSLADFVNWYPAAAYRLNHGRFASYRQRWRGDGNSGTGFKKPPNRSSLAKASLISASIWFYPFRFSQIAMAMTPTTKPAAPITVTTDAISSGVILSMDENDSRITLMIYFKL